LKLCALNDTDSGYDWKQKLDASRGQVETTEFRNNSCKLSKWLCQASLADVDTIKIGFVTKVDKNRHSILLIEQQKVTTL